MNDRAVSVAARQLSGSRWGSQKPVRLARELELRVSGVPADHGTPKMSRHWRASSASFVGQPSCHGLRLRQVVLGRRTNFFALGIDAAADEASNLLPRRVRLDGPTPVGKTPVSEPSDFCHPSPAGRLDSISKPHMIGLASVITSSRRLLWEERVLAA